METFYELGNNGSEAEFGHCLLFFVISSESSLVVKIEFLVEDGCFYILRISIFFLFQVNCCGTILYLLLNYCFIVLSDDLFQIILRFKICWNIISTMAFKFGKKRKYWRFIFLLS